eukprot:CAMPEP_0167793428 /NCGR_PEP_ID=MMETSP0111_2-20121227/13175_1 /TAXON_ID=91324 /ORGANISM="Lotharella globosa, Strain CCCM811" /LENGTH=44 /DNA_ID= /DNA_START= /DNA_END= /DNA_ORIENTATION=
MNEGPSGDHSVGDHVDREPHEQPYVTEPCCLTYVQEEANAKELS